MNTIPPFTPNEHIGQTPSEQLSFYQSYAAAERKKLNTLLRTIATKHQRALVLQRNIMELERKQMIAQYHVNEEATTTRTE